MVGRPGSTDAARQRRHEHDARALGTGLRQPGKSAPARTVRAVSHGEERPSYAVTGMGFGSAAVIREIAAPFVAELIEAAEDMGYGTEIPPIVIDGEPASVLPGPGRPIATAGETILVGFLVVVGGGLTAGVTAALGTDIYQELLKKPFRDLVRRLRGNRASSHQPIALLSEVWFSDSEVLVQVVLHFRVDHPPTDASAILIQAVEQAGQFWRDRPGLGGGQTPTAAPHIVRVVVELDGTVMSPHLVHPAFRLPGVPDLGGRWRRDTGSDDIGDQPETDD
jgi:hypothetical protein